MVRILTNWKPKSKVNTEVPRFTSKNKTGSCLVFVAYLEGSLEIKTREELMELWGDQPVVRTN